MGITIELNMKQFFSAFLERQLGRISTSSLLLVSSGVS
jgi:hypothetical protein